MQTAFSHRQLTHSNHQPSGIRYPLTFLLDSVSTAVNVGSAFRLADALGVSKIYLCGTTPVPPNKHISKSSRSTDQVVPWEYFSSPSAAIPVIRAAGQRVIAVELTDRSIPVSEFEFTKAGSICLVAGAENEGVSQASLDLADAVVHIPMRGQNSSMNVATALAIVAYQATSQLTSA